MSDASVRRACNTIHFHNLTKELSKIRGVGTRIMFYDGALTIYVHAAKIRNTEKFKAKVQATINASPLKDRIKSIHYGDETP